MGKKLFWMFFSVALFATVAALVIIGTGKGSQRASVFDQQPFDAVIWKNQHLTQKRDNPRGLMANDIKQRLLSERPTRQQVLELLGPADMADEPDLLSYHMGMWSHNRGRIDTFDIHFGADQRVARIVFTSY